MADVNDIVCLGFGSWSTVYGLPTLGFGISQIITYGTPPTVIRRGAATTSSHVRRGAGTTDTQLRKSAATTPGRLGRAP